MRRPHPALRVVPFTPAPRQAPDLEQLCGRLSDFSRGVVKHLVTAIINKAEQDQRARNISKPVIDVDTQDDREGA